MGTNDISAAKSAGAAIDESWYNDIRSALKGVLVPRNALTGAVAGGEDLGSALYPWANIYGSGLIINGSSIDFTTFAGSGNTILSGKVRSTSAFPDFLRAAGSSAAFTLLADTTDLVLNINGVSTTFNTDIVESALTLAPASNNTATINDAAFTSQESSKWAGEDGTTITISSAGTEITNRIGQSCVFKRGTEYFLAYIKSATELTNCYRGYFFDSSGVPIERVTLANADSISIMSTGWIFAENNATTIDVTYKTPIYSIDEPSSPATGDYWFDLVAKEWNRYNGSAFVSIDRLLIGICVVDTANCVATRCLDFNKDFAEYSNVFLEYESATIVRTKQTEFEINVYGSKVVSKFTKTKWDIASDLESGVSDTSSTTYFFYLTETGDLVISSKKPYNLLGILKGWYHPYNSWLCLGKVFNNSSGDFDTTTVYNFANNYLDATDLCKSNLKTFEGFVPTADQIHYFTGEKAGAATALTPFARTLIDDANATAALTTLGILPNNQIFTSNGTWTKPSTGTYYKVQIWGAGGGGAGSSGFGAAGGAGGSYKEFTGLLSSLPSSVSVTVGTGGAAGSIGNPGVNGGVSTFNGWSAWGGTGGRYSLNSDTEGSPGGGINATAAVGNRFNDLSDGTVVTEGTGAAAYVVGAISVVGSILSGGGSGGGGSASRVPTVGGNSVYGGGGGRGGGATGYAGGTSTFGGNGGANGSPGAAGFAPAGGGGAGVGGAGGAGARGEVRVYVW